MKFLTKLGNLYFPPDPDNGGSAVALFIKTLTTTKQYTNAGRKYRPPSSNADFYNVVSVIRGFSMAVKTFYTFPKSGGHGHMRGSSSVEAISDRASH
ncbi:hypothetical protein M514_00816 [Trichuris suis]|uniref:Uncharacterized protein n=1 Tax=Trichuris suis TaxID=68888 RepID=A0A085N093_9BILA|nr:hypothetical protein M513_00816 [Trichuris suis]KFD62889.1 hypothetical protein M514_00816 [Trichuris suis]